MVDNVEEKWKRIILSWLQCLWSPKNMTLASSGNTVDRLMVIKNTCASKNTRRMELFTTKPLSQELTWSCKNYICYSTPKGCITRYYHTGNYASSIWILGTCLNSIQSRFCTSSLHVIAFNYKKVLHHRKVNSMWYISINSEGTIMILCWQESLLIRREKCLLP